jgi:dipeptidyl aminopeptidase/acylaminoacyl peptidase
VRDIQANILFSPDGKYAYVPVQERGTVPIYRVALSGGEDWHSIISGERSLIPLDSHGSRLLFTSSTLHNPLDLHMANLESGEERQITHLNEVILNELASPVIDHITFPGEDGVMVEGWFMHPPVGQAPYPTILHIHGGPHSSYGHSYYFDQHMYSGAGYGVLFVNHRGSSGYGDQFARQITGDWGNLDFKDLMAGVDLVISKGWADGNRLGVGGISAGGNLTAWIVSHTNRFKAAVCENPVINMLSFFGTSDIGPFYIAEEMGGYPWDIPDVYKRCSPITYAHQCKTPTLLMQSEHDWRCPAEQAEQFYTVLKTIGCITEMLRYPVSFHGAHARGRVPVRQIQNQAQLEWMNRYVVGGSQP